jgi:signal transduction histidine kinase
LAGIATSDWFIPSGSPRAHPIRGLGYSIYIVGLVFAYFALVGQAVYEIRRLNGIHLVEVKTLLVGGAVSCLVGLGFTTLPTVLDLPSMASYAPLAVLLFYSLTAWGITSQRILDAQQLFLTVVTRFAVLGIASALLSVWLNQVTPLLPPGVAMILGFSAMVTLVYLIDQKIKGSSFSTRTSRAEEVRASILSAGREEVDPDELLGRYRFILRDWGRTANAYVRIAGSTGQSGNPWILAADSPGLLLLQEERWATPESLARRRLTPAVDELDRFMAAQKLGVLVLSPRALGTTPIAVGLGQRDDGMPFLWPEIRTLMQWAELMEVAISRVQLTKRARETEQVATAGLLGASLAHEIRNPLVALKTFAQLLPERHNDPEFRDEFSKLLQKEVGRIEGLTEQLLKLSTPHKPVLRPVRLSEIITDCTNLLKAKFADSHTSLSLDLTPHERPIMADGGSVSQVVLNLLVNAQQALASQAGERLIRVRTEQLPDQLALEIADNGPGINAKQRERLFQPFSSGKINGFGLGLALSANIMRVHQGSIKLVETGHPGATFRLIFPCPPSSS